MSAIVADRLTYISIKVFLCQRGHSGRESRIKFYSPDHPDRWSPTVGDVMSSVPIGAVTIGNGRRPSPIVTDHLGTRLDNKNQSYCYRYHYRF